MKNKKEKCCPKDVVTWKALSDGAAGIITVIGVLVAMCAAATIGHSFGEAAGQREGCVKVLNDLKTWHIIDSTLHESIWCD